MIDIIEKFNICNLSKDDINKYSRQMLLKEINVEGQQCLKNGSVLIFGASNSASSCAMYLAGSGIGTIGLSSDFKVTVDDVGHEFCHGKTKIGLRKDISLKLSLELLNSQINIIEGQNIDDIINFDIIIDCTEELECKYKLSDACFKLNKPLFGSITNGFKGCIFSSINTSCCRCLFSNLNLSINKNFAPVSGLMGILQATEVIKYFIGSHKSNLSQKILLYNAFDGSFKSLNQTIVSNNCRICNATKKVDEKELFDFLNYNNAEVRDLSAALKSKKALIIGCGGLGCPSSSFLALAGIGTLGLIDHDVVDESNLHRQVCHTALNTNRSKVESLTEFLKDIRPDLNVVGYKTSITSDNAMDIFEEYDVILDCTDNVVSRYLINDCAVLSNKVLVSASALKLDGQLSIYHYDNGDDSHGLCYRCLLPVPPPRTGVANCNEAGVLGTVPGAMGVLQAIEAIKVLTNIGKCIAGKLLVYNAMDIRTMAVKLCPRKASCAVCGTEPSINSPIDYEAFCNMKMTDHCPNISLLDRSDRLTIDEYCHLLDDNIPHILIDVRPMVQIKICGFAHSLNLDYLDFDKPDIQNIIFNTIKELHDQENVSVVKVITLCRRGNDSQRAALHILKQLKNKEFEKPIIIKDVIGGITTFARKYIPSQPCF